MCEHVLDKILGAEPGVNAMGSNNSQSNQNDNSSEGSQVPPEDKIELFCNNVVSMSSLGMHKSRYLIVLIVVVLLLSVT